jgi:hypothetical protein
MKIFSEIFFLIEQSEFLKISNSNLNNCKGINLKHSKKIYPVSEEFHQQSFFYLFLSSLYFIKSFFFVYSYFF